MGIRIDNRTMTALKVRLDGCKAVLDTLRLSRTDLTIIIELANSDRLVQAAPAKAIIYADTLNSDLTTYYLVKSHE